jgi:hypothetical protein
MGLCVFANKPPLSSEMREHGKNGVQPDPCPNNLHQWVGRHLNASERWVMNSTANWAIKE